MQSGQPPPGQGEIVRREDGGTSGGGWNEPVRRGEEERNVVRVAFIKGLFRVTYDLNQRTSLGSFSAHSGE